MKRLHAGLPGDVLLVLDAAYAEYVRRNDYSSGVELAAEAENVVMTRTFSKIFGLANLRIGWAYGPAAVIDALNRTRGPFNVNRAGACCSDRGARRPRAYGAGGGAQQRVARMADRARSRRSACASRRASAISCWSIFPTNRGRGAAEADAFLRERGLVLRRVGGYGLPNALRMTVGSEEANRQLRRRARRISSPRPA